MKLKKGTIIAILAVVAILAGAFFLQGEGDAPADDTSVDAVQQENTQSSAPESAVTDGSKPAQDAPAPEDTKEQTGSSEQETPAPTEPAEQEPEKEEEQPTPEQSVEQPEPDEQPTPQEPEKLTCTFSINCATVLDNMDKLTPGKEGLIPADGVLLAETEVELMPGDTAFSVLQRELKNRNMHFEYSTAALYDTAYIEGICNLYEYDCGELSGWEYAVNGTFYSYGSSQFTLYDGDVVAWVYTCDLGADIGDGHRG